MNDQHYWRRRDNFLLGVSRVMSRTHHPKTIVVPIVVRVIVVASRDARVVYIVVPRAAPQRYPVGPIVQPT